MSLPRLIHSRESSLSVSHRYNLSHSISGARSHLLRLHNSVSFDGHRGCVNTAQWTDSGGHIITGSDDLFICIHASAQPPQEGLRVSSPIVRWRSIDRANVFSAKLLGASLVNESNSLVSCGRDGLVVMHLLRNGTLDSSRIISRHRGSASRISVEPSSNNEHFASAGEDGKVFIFDTRQGAAEGDLISQVFTLKCERGRSQAPIAIRAIAHRPSAPHEILVAGEERPVVQGAPVRIFDVRNLSLPVATIIAGRAIGSFVTGADWSHDGQRLVVTVNDEDSHVFDFGEAGARILDDDCIRVFSGLEERRMWPPPDSPPGAASNPRAPAASTPSSATLRGHRNHLTIKNCAFYGPRSEYVLQGCDTGRLIIYDAANGRVVTAFVADRDGPPNNIAPHPRGLPFILTSGIENRARLWVPGPRRKDWTPRREKEFNELAEKLFADRRNIFEGVDDDEEDEEMDVDDEFIMDLLRRGSVPDEEETEDGEDDNTDDDTSDTSDSNDDEDSDDSVDDDEEDTGDDDAGDST